MRKTETTAKFDAKHGGHSRIFVPPPMGHRINQESRYETLKHFHHLAIFSKVHGKNELVDSKRSLLFNSSRDTLALFTAPDRSGLNDTLDVGLLKTLPEESLALLGLLRSVRVVEMVQYEGMGEPKPDFEVLKDSVMHYLSGLEELRLTSVRKAGRNWDCALNPARLRVCAKVYLRFFEKQNAVRPPFKVPSITFHRCDLGPRFGRRVLNSKTRYNKERYILWRLEKIVEPKKLEE